MIASLSTCGSPPHAWGILLAPGRKGVCGRFTPTCVGNTGMRQAMTPTTPVHPHMRGEYTLPHLIWLNVNGSPPHAWGILSRPASLAIRWRFTPTCVGNTRYGVSLVLLPPVHPHMRGEYSPLPCLPEGQGGSPPHAWGIPLARQPSHPCARFTPTCVGNTRGSRSTVKRRTVHPHMRGEYVGTLSATGNLTGSPPHAWGIR